MVTPCIGSLDPGMMVTMSYWRPQAMQGVARDIVFGDKTRSRSGASNQ
jgi:hypothetical protein